MTIRKYGLAILLILGWIFVVSAQQTTNTVKINNSTTATGNGATDAGTQRVTISNDSTGKVAVTQSTTGNLHAMTDLEQVGGNTVATAASGIQKVGVTDGSGNAITSTGGKLDVNATVSANADQMIHTGIGYPSGAAAVMGATSDGSTVTLNSPVVVGGVDANGKAQTALVSPLGAFVVDLSATNSVTANISQIGGSSVATAASGIIKIGVTDGTGNAITSSGGSPNGLDVHIVPGANTIGTVNAVGAAADGAAASTNPVRTAGKDGNGNTQDILTSTLGALIVDLSATPGTVNATLQTQTDTTMVGGVNIKEINAVTPLMGNGVTGTGSQRVTLASDNSAVSGLGAAATTGAVPANAIYQGANAGGLRGVTAIVYGGTGIAEDTNIATVAGTAVTTATAGVMKVGISGATGTTLDGTAGTASSGVLTVQFADSNLPFQTMVCPTNAFRIEGTTSVTGTSSSNITWLRNNGTTTTFTSPPGTGLRFYIFSAQLVNSGATNVTVNLSADGAVGVPPTTLATWVAPTNTTPFGGSNMDFPSGMFTPTTGRALSIVASGSSTTVYANLQGCLGP